MTRSHSAKAPRRGGGRIWPAPGVELKVHVEAYETARHATHRAFLIMCGTSVVLLGLARTPKLVINKFGSVFGAEVATPPNDRFPISSYAIVLGLVAIPILVQWCYRKLVHALRLRSAVQQLADGPPDAAALTERLAPPLLGSLAARSASWVAWAAAVLTVVVAALIPIVTSLMMLWDYSHKFTFSEKLARFNGPFALWVTAAGGDVVRPDKFDGIASDYHPALLPWWQPWVYLVLLLWAIVLIIDGTFRLGGRINGVLSRRPAPDAR